ncbi:hypothetical protein L3i22_042150 [Actinoplanes sp. L3-i22]|nr:hypothetical protein L3i22_042150 [Actinoplanes sp. L3-i22]
MAVPGVAVFVGSVAAVVMIVVTVPVLPVFVVVVWVLHAFSLSAGRNRVMLMMVVVVPAQLTGGRRRSCS